MRRLLNSLPIVAALLAGAVLCVEAVSAAPACELVLIRNKSFAPTTGAFEITVHYARAEWLPRPAHGGKTDDG